MLIVAEKSHKDYQYTIYQRAITSDKGDPIINFAIAFGIKSKRACICIFTLNTKGYHEVSLKSKR